MESMLDDCLAQFSSKYVLKEEQRQAVLGLQEQKDVVAKAIFVVLVFLKAGFNKRKSSSGASDLITSRRTNPA